MLLKTSVPIMYDMPVCKHIIQILLRDGELYRRLYECEMRVIDTYLNEKDPDGTIFDGFTGMMDFLENYMNVDPKTIDRLKQQFSSYLLTFDEVYLVAEYLEVPSAQEAVRSGIEDAIRSRIKGKPIRFSDSDWAKVYLSFKEFTINTSSGFGYQPRSNTPVAWLRSVMTNYVKGIPSEVMELATSSGLNQELDGRDFSASDYQSERVTFARDLEKFDVLANDIFNVSNFMFLHNKDVFYDLFSRYKFKRVREHKALVDRLLHKIFDLSSLRTQTSLYDPNFKVSDRARSENAAMYALDKLKVRDQMLSEFDPLIEGRAGLSELSRMIKQVLYVNESVAADAKKKNGKVVFDTEDHETRDALSNEEKLELLYKGIMALKKFVDYLKENNINPLSVPSAIFRDKKLLRRFSTFENYMKGYEETLRLVEEEETSSALLRIPSNDDVYEDLMRTNVDVLKTIPLKNMRSVVDSVVSSQQKETPVGPKNEFDTAILGRAWERYARFVGNPDTPDSFKPIRAYQGERQFAETLKRLLINKGIMEDELTEWVVKPPAEFMDFVKLFKGENDEIGLENTKIIASFSQETGSNTYLGYFRTLEFFRVYLSYVRDLLALMYRGPEGRVIAQTKFQVFRTINDNLKLFKVVKNPTHMEELMEILDHYQFEYYFPPDVDTVIVNNHLLSMHNLFMTVFSELFEYADSLYQDVYRVYSEGVQSEVLVDFDLIEMLKREGVKLYREQQVSKEEFPNFYKFLKTAVVDPDTGFVKKNGRFYLEYELKLPRYLHERGHWLVVYDEKRAIHHSVRATDNFGG